MDIVKRFPLHRSAEERPESALHMSSKKIALEVEAQGKRLASIRLSLFGNRVEEVSHRLSLCILDVQIVSTSETVLTALHMLAAQEEILRGGLQALMLSISSAGIQDRKQKGAEGTIKEGSNQGRNKPFVTASSASRSTPDNTPDTLWQSPSGSDAVLSPLDQPKPTARDILQLNIAPRCQSQMGLRQSCFNSSQPRAGHIKLNMPVNGDGSAGRIAAHRIVQGSEKGHTCTAIQYCRSRSICFMSFLNVTECMKQGDCQIGTNSETPFLPWQVGYTWI